MYDVYYGGARVKSTSVMDATVKLWRRLARYAGVWACQSENVNERLTCLHGCERVIRVFGVRTMRRSWWEASRGSTI